MCEKAVLENVHNCFKNQEMCNKAVDNYPHVLEFVPYCYMTQEMGDKVVNTHSSTIRFPQECCNKKMCDKAFNKCFRTFLTFLIDIKLKKCVTDLFLMILFY